MIFDYSKRYYFSISGHQKSFFNRRRREIDTTASKSEYLQISNQKYAVSELMGSLPVNRTVIFSCNNKGLVNCVRYLVNINNFRVHRDKSAFIKIKFTVDLNEVDQILTDPLEFFVIETNVKAFDEDDNKG